MQKALDGFAGFLWNLCVLVGSLAAIALLAFFLVPAEYQEKVKCKVLGDKTACPPFEKRGVKKTLETECNDGNEQACKAKRRRSSAVKPD